jgi:hypothetical protein
MGRVHSSEMFNSYETTRCCNPEDHDAILTAVKAKISNPVISDTELQKEGETVDSLTDLNNTIQWCCFNRRRKTQAVRDLRLAIRERSRRLFTILVHHPCVWLDILRKSMQNRPQSRRDVRQIHPAAYRVFNQLIN